MAGRNVHGKSDQHSLERSSGVGSTPPEGSLRAGLIARAARLRIPLNAQIEATSRCNLRCLHCYVAGDHAHPETPELDLARQLALIDELADAGCMFLTLTGGEVVLKRGWLRLVEAARRKRMSVTILTNGTLLTADHAAALAHLKVRRVSISIYGDTADVHDGITGVRGSFAKSQAAVQCLRSLGIEVRIATVLMNENVSCFDGVRRLAEGLGCSYRFEPTVRPMSNGATETLKHRLSADAMYQLYSDPVIGPRTAEGKYARMASKDIRRDMNDCAAGVSAVFIDASGWVYPCPGFLPGFGSVRDQSFSEVWTGRAAEEFRDTMQQPVVECLECDDRQYCLTRCPCLAAVEDGSSSGRSSRACEIASLSKRLCEEATAAACIVDAGEACR